MSDAASRTTVVAGSLTDRRREIDWLRMIGVLLIVPVHGALLFAGGYYLTPPNLYEPLWYFFAFLRPWHMPILFVLSGMATWLALGKYSSGRYAWDRTKRLVVPLVFGTFVLIPPQVYLQRLTEGRFHGSLVAFYPHFFEGFWPVGNFTYAHLWFIAYLWIYSLVALPVLVFLRGSAGRRLMGVIAAGCLRHRGAIFLLAAPMAASESLLHARFPWNWIVYNDWSMFTWHLLQFLLGYVVCSDDRFRQAIRRDGPVAMVLALAAASIHVGRAVMELWVRPTDGGAWTVLMIFNAFQTWVWMVALLWFGGRFLNVTNRWLGYAREASYPFYVLHQTVMMGIGYWIAWWPVHALIRFVALCVATTIGTILVYDVFVRRWSVMRFFFGLRRRPRGADALEPATTVAVSQ
ncbi:MAG: acyltransferase [Phycisphaerae bacterium]|nr:acyltransferase [Phycisphaerae bacterium]